MIDLKFQNPYMSAEELASFKRDRASNKISMFRVRTCEGIFNMDGPGKAYACKTEIPAVDGDDGPLKRYCSRTCFDNNEHVKKDDDDKDEW